MWIPWKLFDRFPLRHSEWFCHKKLEGVIRSLGKFHNIQHRIETSHIYIGSGLMIKPDRRGGPLGGGRTIRELRIEIQQVFLQAGRQWQHINRWFINSRQYHISACALQRRNWKETIDSCQFHSRFELVNQFEWYSLPYSWMIFTCFVVP